MMMVNEMVDHVMVGHEMMVDGKIDEL